MGYISQKQRLSTDQYVSAILIRARVIVRNSLTPSVSVNFCM